MVCSLRLLIPPIPRTSYSSRQKPHAAATIANCSTNPTREPDLGPPQPGYEITPQKKSVIGPEDRRRSTALDRPEPPNFEIGWRRTKDISTEKVKGWQIADFLEKLETLMGREYGSTEMLAKVGSIVSERAREEAEILRELEAVDERRVTELFRVLRLVEMDLEMVKAAVRAETVAERIEQAKARCRQAILVALSL